MFDFSTLPFGLTVTGIGILIVFFGLVVLIGLIKIMQMATSGMGKKAKKTVQAPAAPSAPAPAQDEELMAVIAAAVAAQDQELIAVISAAVAAMMEEEGKTFVVRRVRRINNAPAWHKAGREEQVYSRF